MAIKILDVSDVSVGRTKGKGKGKGARYTKYRTALQKVLPIFIDGIEKKGTIAVKVSDLAEEMGNEYKKLHPTSIKWGVKHALFFEGIWSMTGKDKNGDPVILMRAKTDDDVLPDSLQDEPENADNGEDDSAETEHGPEDQE
jgi:hypothetical protein